MAGYSNVAWFYDGLSRVVYGKALVEAQVYLLPLITPNSNILIVGGGTGWVLEEIAQIHPSGLTITYVEVAEKMMTLSRNRNAGNNNVTYIAQPIETVTGLPNFDVIITPFLFDNFSATAFNRIFAQLHNILKSNGIWINTDFQLTGKWWQYVLLKSMLGFFRVLTGIKSKNLPDIETEFVIRDYQLLDSKSFYGEFIVTEAYKK
jgi:ubiquinone/menaquinone biosynthesis C-methylase UbiE